MSTKTSIKRIALVAVSALGFGLLSVVPAKAEAGAGTVTAVTLAATSAGSTTVAVGGTLNVTVGATLPTAANTSAETNTVKVTISSAPTGQSNPTLDLTNAAAAITGAVRASAVDGTIGRFRVTEDNAVSAAGITAGAVSFGTVEIVTTGFVAGTYILTAWHDADDGSDVDAGESFSTIALTVVAAATGVYNSSIQVPISTNTTDNAGVSGLKVNAVSMNTKHVSGRVGVPVVLWPSWQATANGTNVTTQLDAVQATVRYTATNPAGTAQAFTLQGSTTTSAVQHITGSTGAGLNAALRSVQQPGSAIQFTPATAGTYTITSWHDNNNNEVVNVGEASSTLTITVAADAVPSITMTTYGVAIPVARADGDKSHGALVKISLKNGANPVSLSSNEIVTVTSNYGSTTAFDEVTTWSSSGDGISFALADNPATETTSVALTRANFNGAGEAYFYVSESTDTGITVSLTAVITGGTAAGGSGSGSVTVRKTSDRALVRPVTTITNAKSLAYVLANPTTATPGVEGANIAAKANTDGNEDYNWTTATGVATALSLIVVPGVANGATVRAVVTDVAGLITGLRGATYAISAQSSTSATVSSTATFTGPSVAVPTATADLVGTSLSTTAPAWATNTGAYNIKVQVDETTSGTDAHENIAVANATPLANTIYIGNTADGLSSATFSARAATGAKTTIYAQVYDQHGRPAANIGITPAIAAGYRNPTSSTPTVLVTDASGRTSFTWTDASTSTTVLSDVLTLSTAAGQSTSSSAKTGTATLNYATYLPVSTITLTTPDSANATLTGIAGQITSDISSVDGAEELLASVSAVLKDANGATLPSGVAVTWTISGNSGAAILSTKKVTYTNDAGSASTSVYAWLNGNATVTATAGSVTKSGIVYFQQADCTAGSNCAEARFIAAKAAGNVVTATVTDRFGNPIKGVNVVATRSGTGNFNGTSSITGTTDKYGTVDFVLSNGTADVTVAFTSATFGASSATKGYADAGITALTAYTAGTEGKAEEGVGASYDAAGINSVTVKAVADTASVDAANAASDAAAEAIDAANAATDAANLAAEAADAATVAAEEARDAADAATAAVEDLATQVATLMAALKAQITTLANTVAKIAKKVRA